MNLKWKVISASSSLIAFGGTYLLLESQLIQEFIKTVAIISIIVGGLAVVIVLPVVWEVETNIELETLSKGGK